MSDRLFDLDEVPEVPLFREPRRSRGAAIMDARLDNDYPPEWSRCPTCEGRGIAYVGDLDAMSALTCPDCKGMGSVKAMVRLLAGHRCERCLHPYVPKGDAKMLGVEPTPYRWSPCDTRCTHVAPDDGPVRMHSTEFEEVPQLVGADGEHYRAGLVRDSFNELVAVEAEWRILTVHHLDGDKANLRWWNLAALCQRCHLEIQAKVVLERVYPHEHSEWFKPHAAGWYAFSYLCKTCGLPGEARDANHRTTVGTIAVGGKASVSWPGPIVVETGYYPHPFEPGYELTREQALERMDELLGLEAAC